jgi:Predicted CoA-binding protein
MSKLTRDFFNDKEIVFVGYSSKNNAFSKMVYEALVNKGIKVYPVNKKEKVEYDIKVYRSLDELPKVPKTAYVLLDPENAKTAIPQLASKGIKKVLFQNKKIANEDTLKLCKENGVDVSVGCPMMIAGTGMHKFHAFFAGVK